MSFGAKISIIGLVVLAVVVGGLYYIFIYSRNLIKDETVTGINKDQAITTNAARDTGDPAFISSGDLSSLGNASELTTSSRGTGTTQSDFLPNPSIGGTINTGTETGVMSIGFSVPQWVWDSAGKLVPYPGLLSGKPWIWENAQIQGITAYTPGVPWDQVEAKRIPNAIAEDRIKNFIPFGYGSD